MSTPLFEVVEGWTGTIGPFTITKDGAALDLTGMTVMLVLRRATGVLVTPTGAITIRNQVTDAGKVDYAPAAADFSLDSMLHTIQQDYCLRFKIVDGLGKIVLSPHTAAAIVRVHRA